MGMVRLLLFFPGLHSGGVGPDGKIIDAVCATVFCVGNEKK
jgi:hypothetical protein